MTGEALFDALVRTWTGPRTCPVREYESWQRGDVVGLPKTADGMLSVVCRSCGYVRTFWTPPLATRAAKRAATDERDARDWERVLRKSVKP